MKKARAITDPAIENKTRQIISPVEERQADSVAALTGIDASEFDNIIDVNAVEHIDKRHGANGTQDHSMADINDISRISYFLGNFDHAELLYNKDGSVRTSQRWRDRNDRPAPMIQFSKKIDGTMYVVEAVPDSSRKSLIVESAYIQKNYDGSDRLVPNMPRNTGDQRPTSGTSPDDIASIEDSIPASAEKSNPKFKTLNDMVAEKYAPKVRETKYSADARTETASGAGGMPGEARHSVDKAGDDIYTVNVADDRVQKAWELLQQGAPGSEIFNQTGLFVMANGDLMDNDTGERIRRKENGNATKIGLRNVEGQGTGNAETSSAGNDVPGIHEVSERSVGSERTRKTWDELTEFQQQRATKLISDYTRNAGDVAKELIRNFGNTREFAKWLYGYYSEGDIVMEQETMGVFEGLDLLIEVLDKELNPSAEGTKGGRSIWFSSADSWEAGETDYAEREDTREWMSRFEPEDMPYVERMRAAKEANKGRYAAMEEYEKAAEARAEAMKAADRFGSEVMGSRMKGSKPTAFDEKGLVSRMVHMFQIEP